MNCQMCGKELAGKQLKYCSKRCCSATTNNKHQDYAAQQLRGKKRRLELIQLLGGCCCKCGYKTNWSALHFHHLDPTIKLFNVDIRKCSNATWISLVAEVNKCILVCSNCHCEEHNPDCIM